MNTSQTSLKKHTKSLLEIKDDLNTLLRKNFMELNENLHFKIDNLSLLLPLNQDQLLEFRHKYTSNWKEVMIVTRNSIILM